jgi:hypothetical protein
VIADGTRAAPGFHGIRRWYECPTPGAAAVEAKALSIQVVIQIQQRPALLWDPGWLIRLDSAGRHRDDVAADRGHDIWDSVLLQPGAELRVAGVDLVPGDPGERDAGLHS